MGNKILPALAVLMMCAVACKEHSTYESTSTKEKKDSLLLEEPPVLVKDDVQSQCPPGVYMATHNLSSLTLSIATDKPYNLSNDTLALSLLDSMYSGSSEEARRFYFWVVSKSLKRSDGYYSEGVGVTGTSYLFERPSEFISLWKNCISKEEQDSWIYYLAAEQAITSEGYPADSLLMTYQDSLNRATMNLPNEFIAARESLLVDFGAELRVLKATE